MECPNCQKELPALPGAQFCQFCGHELPAGQQSETKLLTCTNCELPALPGAKFCPECGHLLPSGDAPEPQLLTCSDCGQSARPGARFCDQCGEELSGHDHSHQDLETDFSQRVACSDGSCIGIIGPDGKCTECGLPFGSQPEPEE